MNSVKTSTLQSIFGEELISILVSRLSDPHNGGQCAALFACGEEKYIYKPRSAAADAAWADFLEAMEPVVGCELVRAVRPVSPEGAEYTIVPFIEGREAGSGQEARSYYRRAGSLLALCMLLGSTDMHAENLIADGDSPVLVDVETLLAGVTPDKAARADRLYDSLVFSHLLPNWMLMDGENVDVGALTGKGKNQLKMNGAACPAYEYAEEICAGFRAAYRGLMENREIVLREIQRFARAPFRKLLRPTNLYGRLCDQIARLDSPEEKQASADRLKRAYQRGGADWAEKMRRVCDSEIRAVLRGDIPYFFSYGDERCLRDVDGVVAEGYFSFSPVEAARKRLEAFTPADGVAQERIIRQSLAAVQPEVGKRRVSSAEEVFRLLREHEISGCPCGWMGLTAGARGEAYFQSIGFDLYDGLTGVMVFLGALYEAMGDEQALDMLRRHYAEYRKMYVLKETRLRASADSIGLTGGLSGHLLALHYLARVTGEEAFLDDAARLFARFDFGEFCEPERWDVYGGVSGLLMALPLLTGRGMDDELAALAARLADDVRRADVTLTGLAHGAAGLALGLGAAQFVGGGDFSGDILRLLEWENERFDEENLNWPDLRDPQRHGFMKGLCSGAPGIGVARMQLLRYTDDTRIREICQTDVERVRAFLGTINAPLRRDTLCCGNAALIEAERVLTGAVSHARLNDEPMLYHALGTDDFPAGLLQGWAGVGYALARQRPAAKHSLFVWEVHE